MRLNRCMGIPAYYKYINSKYKDVTLTQKPEHIDRLFLDFNGIIHGCKHQVLLDQGTENDMYKAVLHYVESIVCYMQPQKLLYIAVDGVAPRAKMEQQRKRRYKSQQDMALEPVSENTPFIKKWDSNAITPGTKFMFYLDKALFYSVYLKTLAKSITVIISNSSVPGEGEQKIYKYLRTIHDGTNVVHGLDADLFMLSLLQKDKNIYLYRELDTKPTFVNIRALSNKLPMPPEDYVFISFLMGNDFIPKTYALYLRMNALDLVTHIYTEIYKTLKKRLVYKSKINHEFLYLLMKKIEERENELVEQRAMKTVYKNFKYHGHSKKDRFDYFPDYHRNAEIYINFGKSGWHSRYYEKCGNGCDDIQHMCREYIRGLAWNLLYYTSKDPTLDCDQGWYYPYAHAPLFKDLLHYLEHNDIETPHSNVSYNAFEQLLTVLPPQSAHLLPKSWQSHVKKNKQQFPPRFSLDPIGCVFRWECAPILPLFDESLYKDYNTFILTENEKKRKKKYKEYTLLSYS